MRAAQEQLASGKKEDAIASDSANRASALAEEALGRAQRGQQQANADRQAANDAAAQASLEPPTSVPNRPAGGLVRGRRRRGRARRRPW
jgi:hypothetical protein